MSAAHPEAIIAALLIALYIAPVLIAAGLAIALADWLESRWPQRNRKL